MLASNGLVEVHLDVRAVDVVAVWLGRV